jgi:hypothetical protein
VFTFPFQRLGKENHLTTSLSADMRTDLCNPLRSLPLRLLMVRREMRSRPHKSGAKMQKWKEKKKNLPRGEKRQNALS